MCFKNKIFLALFTSFVLFTNAFAIEEIKPDFEKIEKENFTQKLFAQKEINLKNEDKIKFGINFKGYNDFTQYADEDDLGSTYNFTIEPYIHSYFGENKNEFRFTFVPTRKVSDYDNKVTAMINDLYYIRHINENHEILIGNSRVPVGFEGATGYYDLPLIQRAQISSNFGDARSLGIKFKGTVNKFDYNIGGYFATRNLQHLNEGGEFVGWLDYNPFKDKENNYLKNLKIGTGINYGRSGENYTVLSTGLKWDYKKFFMNAEYGFAQNYNGAQGFRQGKAQGAFATLGYNLTDKVQILGRYDVFNPNINKNDNTTTQYTAGINWFIIGQRLRLSLNYMFEQQKNNNKNKIMFLTQFLI